MKSKKLKLEEKTIELYLKNVIEVDIRQLLITAIEKASNEQDILELETLLNDTGTLNYLNDINKKIYKSFKCKDKYERC